MRSLSPIRYLLLLAPPFLGVGSAVDWCHTLNVYDVEVLGAGRSISTRLFDVSGFSEYEGDIEALRTLMAEALKEKLEKTKQFDRVAIVSADVTAPDTDLVINGKLSGIHAGSKLGRVLGQGGGAETRLRGSIATGGSEARVVSDFECVRTNMGGLGGLTGGIMGLRGGDSLTRGNVKKFGEQLADSFPEMRKHVKKQGKRDRKKLKVLDGKSQSKDRDWRQVERQDWKSKQFTNEVASFRISSESEDGFGVDALWLTAPAYAAHRDLNLREPDDEDALDGGDLARGLLLDLEPVEIFEDQEVYVIAITYNSLTLKRGPFFWDSREMADSTYLTNSEDETDRLRPLHYLDTALESYLIERRAMGFAKVLFGSHPVIVVFPAKRADGTPFITKLNQTLTLHTMMDNNEIELSIDLSHFDLGGLDELRLRSGTELAER